MSGNQPPARFWKREHIRLDLATYAASGETWLLTITTLDRERRHLAQPEAANAVSSSLVMAHAINRCGLLAFCVMPDHLHTVTQVREGGNLIKMVNRFKSFSARAWWGVGGLGTLWQRSFHDRGLRTTMDIESAVVYVWENPVRSGLVDADDRYPFVGGELFSGS